MVVDAIRADVENFPGFMNCKGHNFVGFPDSIMRVGEAPIDIARRLLDRYKDPKNKIKKVYLNAAAHGNEHGIYFPIPDPDRPGHHKYMKLSPDDLETLFNEYQELDFILDTVACHAGGIPEMMENYKDPTGRKNRIVAFVQTKGTGLNQEGRINGDTLIPKPLSSYYNIFRIWVIDQQKEFGEANLFAGIHAKRLSPSDAEAYVSTSSGGIGTKSLVTPSSN